MTNKRKSTEDLKEGSKLIRSSGTEESKRCENDVPIFKVASSDTLVNSMDTF
jgi:hypothetical protein